MAEADKYTDDFVEFRKQLIIEYMKLGMDMYGAAVAAECPPDLIPRLEADETFAKMCDYHVKMEEVDLLRKLQRTADKMQGKGDIKGLERRLEILNPERYSKTTKLAHQLGTGSGKRPPAGIKISFVSTDTQEASELTQSNGTEAAIEG